MSALRALRQSAIIGVVALALLLLLLAFWLIERTVARDLAQLENTLAGRRQTLALLQEPGPTTIALQATLTTTSAFADQILAAAPPLGINWPQVVTGVDQYDPNQLALVSVTQVNRQLTLSGAAASEDAVVAYREQLEANADFASVVLQSLRVIPAVTVTPAATTTPRAAPAVPLPAFLAPGAGRADFVIIIELDQ
jgi:hypothetical protein